MPSNQMILRGALCKDYLNLSISTDSTKIFAEIDSFVAQSQGNDTISCVDLHPYNVNQGNYELWDKVGQGVGNLRSLRVLNIWPNHLDVPDWQPLARILPYIQNKIALNIFAVSIEGTEEMRAFARVIQGHPAITRFVADFTLKSAIPYVLP
jgi:hypothetical protein